MTSGIVLQMDQTEPADQSLLRHVAQRCEDANSDRHPRLRDHGHPEQATACGLKPYRNPASARRDRIRTNPCFYSVNGLE